MLIVDLPSTTNPTRHVCDINNDKSRVVRLVASDPHTGTTTRSVARTIDAHDDVVRGIADEPRIGGIVKALVLHKAMRRIRRIEE